MRNLISVEKLCDLSFDVIISNPVCSNLYQFFSRSGSFEKKFQFSLMVRILENRERFVDQLIYSNGLCFKMFGINHAQYRFKAGLNR